MPTVSKRALFSGEMLFMLANKTQCQINSFIIKTKNGKIIVIDGGTRGDAEHLAGYIKSNGSRADAWFLTHYHWDHAGVLASVLDDERLSGQIKIEKIYYNFLPKKHMEKYESGRIWQMDIYDILDRVAESKKIILKRGDIFDFDGVKIEAMSEPDKNITENAGNNSSVVLRVCIADKILMFLGDLGIEAGETLLKNYAFNKEKLRADIAQMAHHGSNGCGREVYEAINAEICLWNAPDWLWENKNDGCAIEQTKVWAKETGAKEHYVIKDGDWIFM